MRNRFGLLLCIGLLIFSGSAVYAQVNQPAKPADTSKTPPLNIEISPARLILQGEPGRTIDATLRIRNRNAQSESLKLEIFKVVIKDKIITFQTPPPDDEFVSWVNFGKKPPIVVPFDQWQDVPITIDIPKTAAFAYDYAIAISKVDAPTPAPGETQAVEGKVAQFILLDVISPGAKRQATVESITTSKKFFTYLPVDLSTIVKNTGNLHVAPVGNIFIKNMAGQQIATINVNKEAGNILPNTDRTFNSVWDQGFPRYETRDGKKQLVWNWKEANWLRFGKYKAEVVLIYNDGVRDLPTQASTTFWVIPWPLILIALIILLLILWGIVSIIRSFHRIVRRGEREKSAKKRKKSEAKTKKPTASTRIGKRKSTSRK